VQTLGADRFGRAAKQMVEQEAEPPFVLFEHLVNLVRNLDLKSAILASSRGVLTRFTKGTMLTNILLAPSSFVKPYMIFRIFIDKSCNLRWRKSRVGCKMRKNF
jgi:hypothetical protein